MSNILKRASELKSTKDTVILGKKGTGKSTLAVKIAQEHERVLYVPFGASFDGVKTDWFAYPVVSEKDLTTLQRDLDPNEVDVIILDAFGMALSFFQPTESMPTRAQYGSSARQWADVLASFRSAGTTLIVTLNLVEATNENGASLGLKPSVNPYSFNRIAPVFSKVYYTYAGVVNNETKYYTQTDKLMALAYSAKGGKSVLTEKLNSDTLS